MSEDKIGLDPEDRRMTVGEHLDELRRRVLRSVIYLALALVVCLIFNRYIMGWIVSQPYGVLKELGYDRPAIQALCLASDWLEGSAMYAKSLTARRNGRKNI